MSRYVGHKWTLYEGGDACPADRPRSRRTGGSKRSMRTGDRDGLPAHASRTTPAPICPRTARPLDGVVRFAPLIEGERAPGHGRGRCCGISRIITRRPNVAFPTGTRSVGTTRRPAVRRPALRAADRRPERPFTSTKPTAIELYRSRRRSGGTNRISPRTIRRCGPNYGRRRLFDRLEPPSTPGFPTPVRSLVPSISLRLEIADVPPRATRSRPATSASPPTGPAGRRRRRWKPRSAPRSNAAAAGDVPRPRGRPGPRARVSRVPAGGDRRVQATLDPEAPLIVAEAVWQYSHHVLAGLTTHRGPILTVANWSGQWPGLVGLLNLNGSLRQSRACSSIRCGARRSRTTGSSPT